MNKWLRFTARMVKRGKGRHGITEHVIRYVRDAVQPGEILLVTDIMILVDAKYGGTYPRRNTELIFSKLVQLELVKATNINGVFRRV